MRFEFKEYYETLGVSRTAGEAEIKKAYRRLARQFHPDVAKNKREAEERFKRINEAYEVLTRFETRGSYRERNRRTRGRQTQGRPATGSPGERREESSYRHQRGSSGSFDPSFGYTGRRPEGPDFQRGDPGQGRRNDRTTEPEIEVLVTLDEIVRGSMHSILLIRSDGCDCCERRGYLGLRICPACKGAGCVLRTKTYRVRIPAGVGDGQRFRLVDTCENGAGESKTNSFFIRIRLAPHPVFRVENGILHCDLRVAAWNVVFGGIVPVPTPTGSVRIKLPGGVREGQKLRLRGHGLPANDGKPGDLYLVIRIQIAKSARTSAQSVEEEIAFGRAFTRRR